MKKRSTKSRKEMKSPKFNSVGAYLASGEPTEARILRSVIDLILAKFPELESQNSDRFYPSVYSPPFSMANSRKAVSPCGTKLPNHATQRTAASPYVQVTQSSRA